MARCSGWRKEPMAEREASPGRGDDQLPRYRVAAVERMTRVPASTLRSWERRYGWPRPLRAASGQRLYSDHDVALIHFLNRRRDVLIDWGAMQFLQVGHRARQRLRLTEVLLMLARVGLLSHGRIGSDV